ncbi:radical SAM protein [Candidatus Pelagibacter sp.]|nr:radical SAM protein [Candidatus Pelagibacter sp.]
MDPLKVYLCDLTHETVILVSDTIPLNIGYVGSYAKKEHGEKIELSLFKYAEKAINAIKKDPPDVLALSNYSWNSLLSEKVAGIAKRLNPKVITIQGGPNFPHASDLQLEFLKQRPNTNFHIMFEGEASFSNILDRILKDRANEQELFDEPINGSVFIHPNKEKGLIKGAKSQERIKYLDDIPSPYLNGMLDEFFDGRLSPFIETNRGCPFKCSFCHTGNDYFQKVHMFSMERIRAEMEYMGQRASKKKNTILHLADVNFGMFPRDREVSSIIVEMRDKYNWPLSICGSTGKNNKERIIDITSVFGDAFIVSMSTQSMDEKVLKNINRSNIKLDHFKEINKHLKKVGRATSGDLIIGLPGETKESFMKGALDVIDSGVQRLVIYTLMMLYGTEFKDPGYRSRFNMSGKYRIIPLNCGDYDGEKVFDYEEVCIENKDMSFEDYLYMRKFALITEIIFNNQIFEVFFRYALSEGMQKSEFIIETLKNIETAPKKLLDLFAEFNRETREELWDSEEEMVKHYKKDENYKKLVSGEAGGNLMYRYKSLNMVNAMPEWMEYLTKVIKKCIVDRNSNLSKEELKIKDHEINNLVEFHKNKTWKFLENTTEETLKMKSDYNFSSWLSATETEPLSSFKANSPIEYYFKLTERQKNEKQDMFRRYGTDINALSKIVVRIKPENWLRSVATDQAYIKDKMDDKRSQARYSLSN